MSSEIHITLNAVDLGQIIDGLSIRAEEWERTACWLRGEMDTASELFLIQECSCPDEAERIARHYWSIVESIRNQTKHER